MAAPNLQAEGSIAAVITGSLTVTLAAHQADDILILCLMFWGPNSTLPISSIPTPSGWTLIDFQNQPDDGSGDSGQVAWFWMRATSGSETNPVCSRGSLWDTGNDTCFAGRAYTIRGCITSGDPWDATAKAGPHTAANGAVAAVTVSGSERMVVQFEGQMDNATPGTITGWTAGTSAADATGTDAEFQTYRKDNVSSSTSADASTHSAPAQGAYAYLGISFKPPAGAQTISGVGNIGSGQAFGTSKLNMNIGPSAIASAQAFGSAKLNMNIVPSGIGSAQAFGTSKLNMKILLTGIASAEAFGTITLTGGAPSITPPKPVQRIAINRRAPTIVSPARQRRLENAIGNPLRFILVPRMSGGGAVLGWLKHRNRLKAARMRNGGIFGQSIDKNQNERGTYA